eukprot:g70042.t1
MVPCALLLMLLLLLCQQAKSELRKFYAPNSTRVVVYSALLPKRAVQLAANDVVVEHPLRAHRLICAWRWAHLAALPIEVGALDIVILCYPKQNSGRTACGRIDTDISVSCRYQDVWDWSLAVNGASWLLGAGVPLAAHATGRPRRGSVGAAIAVSWLLYLGVALPLSAAAYHCLQE